MIGFLDRLKSNNPDVFGIVAANEIAGHRTIDSLDNLYKLSAPILSLTKENSGNDALGQLWYVVKENSFYQLIDWEERETADGWKKYEPRLTSTSIKTGDIGDSAITEAKLSSSLQEKINKIKDTGFSVELEGGQNAKKGTTAEGILTWSITSEGLEINPKGQSLDGVSLDPNIRSYAYSVSEDKTFTLVVDGITRTASVNFYNPTYLGIVSFDYTPTAENIPTEGTDIGIYGKTTYIKIIETEDISNKIVFAFPESLGTTIIRDLDGADVTESSFNEVTGLTVNGEEYLVYVSKNAANLNKLQYSFSIVSDLGESEDGCISERTVILNNLLEGGTDKALSAEMGKKLNEEKVDRDDNAPKLTAGFANNLVGRGEATEETIDFRPSGGNTSIEDGTARIERLKGNTVVWNQLGSAVSDKSVSGVTLTVKNDSFTLTGSATADGGFYNVGTTSMRVFLPDGHKGLFLLKHLSGTYTVNPLFSYGAVSLKEGESVIKTDSTNYKYLLIRFSTGDVFDNATFSFILHDLTQMFGAGNEPTTIEEFNARKPLGIDEYAYNEGELISTTADEIKSVGFNAWDEEWEVGAISGGDGSDQGGIQVRSKGYIRIIPNAEYQIICTSNKNQGFIVVGYDENLNYIGWLVWQGGTRTFTTQSNARYIRFCTYAVDYGTTYKNDICIHLVHTGYRNGEYEPYEEFRRSLPISEIKDSDGNQLFPNGLLSAGSVYDEITATKAIKRIGVVDLGTLNWMYDEGRTLFHVPYVLAKPIKDGNTVANLTCIKYEPKAFYQMADKTICRFYAVTNGFNVKDSSYTDAATFKAAMSGVILYYELAEPIEVDLPEPINMDYEVSDFGTEEVISDTPTTLLNADIIYQFNAVDRIRDNSRHTAEAEITLDILQKGQLNLTVKDNGNIVLSNSNGVSKEFMPATPSGDPMHYAYIAAGAEWNDTDATITKTAPWGDSVEHLPKYWYLNGLGDITNEQMAAIYNAGKYKGTGSSYACYNDIRTFLPAKHSGQEGFGSFNIRGMLYKCSSIEVACFTNESTLTIQYGISVEQDVAFTFFGCYNLKYIQEINLSSASANVSNLFYGCRELVHVKIFNLKVNLSFEYSSKISKESICFIIQKSKPTKAITVTLHPDAYARLANDADVIADLEAKNTALQGTGGSISLVSA